MIEPSTLSFSTHLLRRSFDRIIFLRLFETEKTLKEPSKPPNGVCFQGVSLPNVFVDPPLRFGPTQRWWKPTTFWTESPPSWVYQSLPRGPEGFGVKKLEVFPCNEIAFWTWKMVESGCFVKRLEIAETNILWLNIFWAWKKVCTIWRIDPTCLQMDLRFNWCTNYEHLSEGIVSQK